MKTQLNIMLDTWGRFASPNNQLTTGSSPPAGAVGVPPILFWKNSFGPEDSSTSEGTCAHSLSHKGCDNHKSNPRFQAAWALLCLPGMVPTPSIFPLLLLTHNSPTRSDHYQNHHPLGPPDFLDELASSPVKRGGTALFHFW